MVRPLPILLTIVIASVLATCTIASHNAVSVEHAEPTDAISRNVHESQGGAVHDNYSRFPPPIRREAPEATAVER